MSVDTISTAGLEVTNSFQPTLNSEQVKTLGLFNNSLKMTTWLFWKLPAAWFMGVRLLKAQTDLAQATLPLGWRSQNPFQSIYFAAQCSAAELSTGVLATLAIQGRGKVSMLVSHIEADFMKKATSRTVFTCTQGEAIFKAVDKAIETGEAQVLVVESVGVQATGEIVSKMYITWSFKAKN
jgi:hypothetical protein